MTIRAAKPSFRAFISKATSSARLASLHAEFAKAAKLRKGHPRAILPSIDAAGGDYANTKEQGRLRCPVASRAPAKRCDGCDRCVPTSAAPMKLPQRRQGVRELCGRCELCVNTPA